LEPPELFFRPPEWYPSRKIDIHLSQIAKQQAPKAHTLALASGESISYDRLLLAAGSSGVAPGIPGPDLPNVFLLRTLQDAAGGSSADPRAWRRRTC
jgi:NAD(P)H-nitrite reductase large subunit